MKKKPKHVCNPVKEIQWVDRPVEKVVYKTHFAIYLLASIVCIAFYYLGSYSEVRLQSKVDQPYVVYRPDQETTAKLSECQKDYLNQRKEIRELKSTIESME